MEDGMWSSEGVSKIHAFTDLETWREGHVLVLAVYHTTASFPREEQYGLTSQMRRCFISVTSNIAEGFGRRTMKDKIQFYFIARGSLIELYNQLLIAKDVGFMTGETFEPLENKFHSIHRLLNVLITKSKELSS